MPATGAVARVNSAGPSQPNGPLATSSAASDGAAAVRSAVRSGSQYAAAECAAWPEAMPARSAPSRSCCSTMAGELRHRGPDGTGLYLDGRLGMVNTRLAIVDLEGGDQPLS